MSFDAIMPASRTKPTLWAVAVAQVLKGGVPIREREEKGSEIILLPVLHDRS